MVLRPRRDTTVRVHSGNHRVRHRNMPGKAIAGSGVQSSQEARVRGVLPGGVADSGAAVQAEDDEQVQEVLEVVSPFCRVRMRGARVCERVSGFSSDGSEQVIREAGVLPGSVDAGGSVHSAGGELVGCVL